MPGTHLTTGCPSKTGRLRPCPETLQQRLVLC